MIVEYIDNGYRFGIKRSTIDPNIFYCYHHDGQRLETVEMNQDGSPVIGQDGYCITDPVREQAYIDSLLAETLDEERAEIYNRIDNRTAAIEAAGCLFKDKMLSMSMAMRSNLAQLRTMSAHLTYPFELSSVDGSFVSIDSEADFNALCLAVLAGAMAVEQAGIAQKKIVSVMTSLSELAAYVDPR